MLDLKALTMPIEDSATCQTTQLSSRAFHFSLAAIRGHARSCRGLQDRGTRLEFCRRSENVVSALWLLNGDIKATRNGDETRPIDVNLRSKATEFPLSNKRVLWCYAGQPVTDFENEFVERRLREECYGDYGLVSSERDRDAWPNERGRWQAEKPLKPRQKATTSESATRLPPITMAAGGQIDSLAVTIALFKVRRGYSRTDFSQAMRSRQGLAMSEREKGAEATRGGLDWLPEVHRPDGDAALNRITFTGLFVWQA